MEGEMELNELGWKHITHSALFIHEMNVWSGSSSINSISIPLIEWSSSPKKRRNVEWVCLFLPQLNVMKLWVIGRRPIRPLHSVNSSINSIPFLRSTIKSIKKRLAAELSWIAFFIYGWWRGWLLVWFAADGQPPPTITQHKTNSSPNQTNQPINLIY